MCCFIDRFTNKADIYEKSRPEYPPSALTCIIEQGELTPRAIVADIGSGTGKLTKLLVERDLETYAVEPNAEMRWHAERNLVKKKLFHSIAAPAEATSLPYQFVDAITVAQAFHWFNPTVCKIEFKRILKPDAMVFLLWNRRDNNKLLTQKHGELMHQYKVRDGINIDKPYDLYNYFFSDFNIFHYDYSQLLTEQGILSLSFSRSYSPSPSDEQYEPLKEAVQDLFAKYQRNGLVEYCYQTVVVAGRME